MLKLYFICFSTCVVCFDMPVFPVGRTEEGKNELIFLSDRNPTIFERLCASL